MGFHRNQYPDRILTGRVPQESISRQDSFWQGFYKVKIQTGFADMYQDPNRFIFGKGSTGIKSGQDSVCQGFHRNQDRGRILSSKWSRGTKIRAEWLWPKFGRGHGRGQGQLSVFVLSADVVLNGRE